MSNPHSGARNKYYTPKTDRRRGEIYRRIFTLARQVKSFVALDLCPPLTPAQAKFNCMNLARIGRLEKLRPGTCGYNGKPTIYRLPATPAVHSSGSLGPA